MGSGVASGVGSGVAAGDGSGVGSGVADGSADGSADGDGSGDALGSAAIAAIGANSDETRRTIWKTARNVRKRTGRRELDIADKTSTAVTDTTKRHRV